MKNLILVLFVSVSFYNHAQEKTERINRVEISVVATLFYNYAHLGFSSCKERNEHSVFVSSHYLMVPERFNLNISYSYNRFFKDEKLYVPYWFRASNTRRDVGYEDGYFPHTLRFSVGSGIGVHVPMKKRIGLRVEFGLGASLNLTNGKGGAFPYRLNYGDYSFDEYYPQYNPPILPAIRLKIGFTINSVNV